jgi:putative membrane protein
MMSGWYGGGTTGWILMTISMIVFWGGVVALAVWLVRSLAGNDRHAREAASAPAPPTPATAAPDGPRDIIRRRYAAGQIERAEYEQKLKDLS